VRLVAESSQGRSFGDDAVFRTGRAPIVTTGRVTGLGITRATVGGSVDGRGSATVWWIELGRTPELGRRIAGGSVRASRPIAVRRTLTGLAPGKRWFFRVVARNAAGRSAGAIASFATAPVQRDQAGRRVRCTIVGTAVPDVLRGTPRRDVICGLGGNDRIFGLGGNDLLIGGSGWDVVDGGSGRDVLLGGPGRDVLRARDGQRDLVEGGAGRDRAIADRVDRVRSAARVTR
jgi:Ca2+-binding RTX toxin-like protein